MLAPLVPGSIGPVAVEGLQEECKIAALYAPKKPAFFSFHFDYLFTLITLVRPHPASDPPFGPVRGRAYAGQADYLPGREPTYWPRPWR